MDVWLDFAHKTLPLAEILTQQIFNTEGAFQFCSFLPGYTPLLGGGWYPVAFAWSHTGWLAQLAWLRWRYSKDTRWLAHTGHPIVRSAFLFYSANLEEEGDGLYHIPLSGSPEYDGPNPTAWCRDPNIDIALIRRCCDWIREMEQALHINELTGRAQQIHKNLVPYHLVEFHHPADYVRNNMPDGRCVLALWQDKPLDYSHRHPSHLMAIHPGMDITIDGSEEDRKIIEASVAQYLSLGRYCWAGHTYVQMVSFAAVIGKAEMAYNFLCCYRDQWILPNGLHFNREIEPQGNSHFSLPDEQFGGDAPFTINETCGVSAGISDMLLQGWKDCIRIFPAVPSKWKNLLFVDLLTEGAFSVSALMRRGRVRWVRIKANADGPCRLRCPFGKATFSVSGHAPKREGDLLEWPMTRGQILTLFTSGYGEPDLEQEAQEVRVQGLQSLSLE
jgi:alpha-L-fucosidase 2